MAGLCEQALAGVGVMEPVPGDQPPAAARLRGDGTLADDYFGDARRETPVDVHMAGCGGRCRRKPRFVPPP